jgi:hypothetical protein
VRAIGHLPEGKGLLGALLADPAAIRLRRTADDARSAGFPPGHPPMDSVVSGRRPVEAVLRFAPSGT